MAPQFRPPRRHPDAQEATDVGAGKLHRWTTYRGLAVYTVIAYGIAWPLLIGGFFGTETGVLDPEGGLVALMNQVAAGAPLIAAVVVLAVSQGRQGLSGLGRSLVRWQVHPLWYAFVFVAVPFLGIAATWVFHPAATTTALGQGWSLLYTQLPLGILSIAVFTGLAEEPGWRGYAQPNANRSYPPLLAALIVSVIWALWHLPNALFVQNLPETLAHLLATVVNGFVLAWAYNSTSGSVLIVMLLHGAQNATGGLIMRLFDGSAEGPTVTAYYLISALTFGVLMATVAILTQGRLGLPPAGGVIRTEAVARD